MWPRPELVTCKYAPLDEHSQLLRISNSGPINRYALAAKMSWLVTSPSSTSRYTSRFNMCISSNVSYANR